MSNFNEDMKYFGLDPDEPEKLDEGFQREYDKLKKNKSIPPEKMVRLFYHLFLAFKFSLQDEGACDHEITLFFGERLRLMTENKEYSMYKRKNLLSPEAVALHMVVSGIMANQTAKAYEKSICSSNDEHHDKSKH